MSHRRHHRIKHHLGRCWIFFGVLMLTMALIFSVFRALTPWARQYKPLVEAHLSKLLEQPVSINTMETSWYWFQPVLRLNELAVTDQKNHVLQLKKLLVGINVLSSLWHWKLQPGILYIDDTHLILHQVRQHWILQGLDLTGHDVPLDADVFYPLLAWLSSQEKIIFRHVSIAATLNDGRTLPLTRLNLTIKNNGGAYHLNGLATFIQKTPTHVTISADLTLDPLHLNKAHGRIYLGVESFMPSQWQRFLPSLPVKVLNGKGDLTLWGILDKGQVSEAQTAFEFHDLVLQRRGVPTSDKVRSVSANLGWKRTAEGWGLEGDHVKLNMNKVMWPENSFYIHRNDVLDATRLFVKHVLLKPLSAMNASWSDPIKPLLERAPEGELYDTELGFKSHALDYCLTGFSDLKWRAVGSVPGFQHLSGVLYWQPQEGRVEIDSYDLHITPPEQTPMNFERFNMAVEWKPSGQGTRFILDHWVIKNPDLSLNAKGTLDKPDVLSKSQLHLVAQFSAQQAEQWIKRIPSSTLKPKLNDWLKQDIKQIGKATGKMTVDGVLGDFPFDKAPGEFSIITQLTGLDLYINSNWPLTHAIDATLTVDKRNLSADIYHANLGDVVVNNMNIRLDDIGLDYETLLIHGKIKADARRMLTYVFSTPLGKRLSQLKPLQLSGSSDLDLKIEVPLYPENDEVLTQGKMILQNNQLILHQDDTSLTLDKLSGLVVFNEKGVDKSTLTAMLGGIPLSMVIQTIKQPTPATQVVLSSQTQIDVVQQTLKLPVLNHLSGPLRFKGLLTLTDDPNAFDTLIIESTLKGIHSDFPAPFEKKAGTLLPLKAQVNFNSKKPMQFLVNLGDKESGVVIKATKMSTKEWSLQITHKLVNADVRYQFETHALTGVISRLALPKQEGATSDSSITHAFEPNQIPNLHLQLQHLTYGDVEVGDVALDTKSSNTLLKIESCKVSTPTYELTLNGSWDKDKAKGTNQTNVEAKLTTTNLEKSLQRWQIKSAIEANKGSAFIRAHWPGFLTDFSLSRVEGQFELILKDGRITDLSSATEEKLGMGKVLSIFSLQTLPRRLKLDFSDLSENGYSYDQFKGDFDLKNGTLSTQNSVMDGPVASVNIKGLLDLVKKRYDLKIDISAHVMASLPVVAATIAGGPIAPIAGLATWAVIKILNQGMNKVISTSYTVTGPWADPLVQSNSAFKKYNSVKKLKAH